MYIYIYIDKYWYLNKYTYYIHICIHMYATLNIYIYKEICVYTYINTLAPRLLFLFSWNAIVYKDLCISAKECFSPHPIASPGSVRGACSFLNPARIGLRHSNLSTIKLSNIWFCLSFLSCHPAYVSWAASRKHSKLYAHMYVYIFEFIYIYIYTCMYVCMHFNWAKDSGIVFLKETPYKNPWHQGRHQ